MTSVSASLFQLIFVSPCRVEDKRQENTAKAEPNGHHQRTLFDKHVIISFDINGDNQQRQNIQQIPTKRRRQFSSFSIIGFVQEMLPAPAVFLDTKQNKGQTAQWQQIVGNDEIFQIQHAASRPQRLKTAPQIKAQYARNAQDNDKNAIDDNTPLAAPSIEIHAESDDIFKNSNHGR